VEGYMDVVALAQHGIEYAVATLGTATTPVHVQKLLRQTDEIVFCFDGDDAGRRAAWRALENSLSQVVDGKRISFLFLPQGEDPDTYVRAHGKPGFEALLHAALPLSRYFLDTLSQRFDLSAAEGRAALIHAAKPLMKLMPNTIFRTQLVHELAQRVRLTPQEVEEQCELPTASPRKRSADLSPSARPSPPALCKQLLRLLVNVPTLAKSITAERREFLKSNPDLVPVTALLDLIEASGATSTGGLTEAARGSLYAPLYDEAARDSLIGTMGDDNAVAELEDGLKRLELDHVKREYEALNNRKLNTEAERQRFVDVSRRLAELKGATAV
jgi:DNA primase